MICSFCFKKISFPLLFVGCKSGCLLGPWSSAPNLWPRPALRFHGCGATSWPTWSSASPFPLLRQVVDVEARPWTQVVDRNENIFKLGKKCTKNDDFGRKKTLGHVSGFLQVRTIQSTPYKPLPLSPLLAMVLCKIIRPAAFSVSKFLLKQLRESLSKASQHWSKQYHLPSTTRPFLPLKFHAELLDFNRRPLSRLRDRRSGDCSGAQGPLHWSFAATETHFSTTRVVHPNTQSHDHHAPVAPSHFTTQGPPRQRSSTQMVVSRLAALSTKKKRRTNL